MVHNMLPFLIATTNRLCPWVAENPGHSLVLTPHSRFLNVYNVCSLDDSRRYKTSVSIVICTYGRPQSLNETLTSLTKQTFQDFEVILITEKGDLSSLRDKGLRCAVGSIVSFIDDDVYCPPTWLEGVVEGFREGVVGVSGPTVIEDEYKSNRDVFKWRRISWLYGKAFLGNGRFVPGYLSRSGTPSLASSNGLLTYDGECEYLEASNMAVKRSEALRGGGFDSAYTKTSEWCEVDLALQLRWIGGKLWYSQKAGLLHRPSTSGIYKARLSTRHRWDNFIYFQKKWEKKFIEPGLRTYAYRAFTWIYLTLKGLGMI